MGWGVKRNQKVKKSLTKKGKRENERSQLSVAIGAAGQLVFTLEHCPGIVAPVILLLE